MNAGAFRQFYEYHFTVNHKLWDRYVAQLSDEQFTQDAGYSHGSVRDQILHLISADDGWRYWRGAGRGLCLGAGKTRSRKNA